MNRGTTAGWGVIILGLAWLQLPAVSAGVIANGDFSQPGSDEDPFAEWTTGATPFTDFARPVDGGGFAEFQITGFFDTPVQLEHPFFLPSNVVRLTFEVQLSSVDGGVEFPFASNDSFQATLFDTAETPQASIGPLFPAFYSLDASGFEDTSSKVSVADLAGDVKRVSLDVTSLPAQNYVLSFALFGDDDGLTSTAELDNVRAVVPEPTSIALWALFGIGACVAVVARRGRCEKHNAGGR